MQKPSRPSPKHNPTNEIVLINELFAAIATENLSDEAIKKIKQDPKACLQKNCNIDISDKVKLQCVNNDENTINLVLPFYSELDKVAQMLNDESLEDFSGGEILITIFALIGAGVGAGIIAALPAAATAGAGFLAIAITSTAVGGAIGAGAVGGIIGGTITAYKDPADTAK